MATEEGVVNKSIIMTVVLYTIFVGVTTGADMSETAPALMPAEGSKAESAITEGVAHYNKGHWDVAEKHFKEAVKADPQSAEAHYDLALALDKVGNHTAASEHFKKAQELGKDNPDIQNSPILHGHLKAKH